MEFFPLRSCPYFEPFLSLGFAPIPLLSRPLVLYLSRGRLYLIRFHIYATFTPISTRIYTEVSTSTPLSTILDIFITGDAR
jgi:hypothetical protein